MQYPEIRDSNFHAENELVADFPIYLPELKVGDLVIVWTTIGGGEHYNNRPSGWTSMGDSNYGTSIETFSMYRYIDGTEGFVGDGTDVIYWDCDSSIGTTFSYSIKNTAGPDVGLVEQGTYGVYDVDCNPGLITFVEPGTNLCIMYMGVRTKSISHLSTGYVDNQMDSSWAKLSNVGYTRIATKKVSGTSENPDLAEIAGIFAAAIHYHIVAIPGKESGGGFGAFGL